MLIIKPRTTINQDAITSSLFHNFLIECNVYRQIFLPFQIIGGGVYNLATFFILVSVFGVTILAIRSAISIGNHYVAGLLFSLIFVSTIFEPDLGSLARHIFPFIPFCFFVTQHNKAKVT
jgi:hypothetical protein